MNWNERYAADDQPSLDDIDEFAKTPLWNDFNAFLQDGYGVEPEPSYSCCSEQPGWNVKYRKGGRSLCTLYPMDGFFIALVVIGNKEYDEALEVIAGCTPYTQTLFEQTHHSAGGRWLMINVTDQAILDDVKRLVQVRRSIKR
ncbi:DUF3788 domain-containing protein [Raoultibacter phocaeensis]|uniref:DUF3788 domain-containing protein n=1 Tax=Raoultibacter phocaeensis TaxID=2479841 RepID=UPI001118AA64|nr:DUF3788 domain-containing protein [Raoultibacter phocaeensis]